ncbi:hypothetical protein ABT124_06415 [Streptomyces sp. NPDC001982]|uniref:hypothetical protein n=1 Tax=Streptomyces sp. NPDC001982 TaxID=3154405 RepID=UPI0033209AEF
MSGREECRGTAHRGGVGRGDRPHADAQPIGEANIAAALRHNARDPERPLALLGLA